MPFGNGFLDNRPFRPNRLLNFDENPTLLGGIGGHRGRGGRGGARGHMRGRQGRFQHDRQYMAHNKRLLATNMLGRGSSQLNNETHDDRNHHLLTNNNKQETIIKLDINGNPIRVCKNPNCIELHPNDNVQCQTLLMAPPEYKSGPPTPTLDGRAQTFPRLTQTNNLKDGYMIDPSIKQHNDQFGKIYECRTFATIIITVSAVIVFAVFIILLFLLT